VHALKFRFMTENGLSSWLYVRADAGEGLAAATLKPHQARLPDLVAVLDRSSAFIDGVRAAGRDPADIELISVDLDPAGREIPGTEAQIGLTRIREPA
jgi:hypothetical protein